MAFDPVAYINEPRWQESRLGLERIRELLDRMGDPHKHLKFVHVAGTNGKGSVCAYLASILQVSGYKTGLFTSPYLIEFNERIRVDGQNIPDADLADVTMFVRDHAEAMAAETGEHPTEFELMTAVAFEYFARVGCDIVVCEVGLGGRLDSTNVIDSPEVCVIARIGLDHTELLGNTLGEVAQEKVGIIKPDADVVAWPDDDSQVMRRIAFACAFADAPLLLPDFSQLLVSPVCSAGAHEGALVRHFRYKEAEYETTLLGAYQPYNAALAIEAAMVLSMRGWGIDHAAISKGIASAVWPGRFEVVEAGPPAFLVDGGHNPQGARALVESLQDVFPGRPVVFIMSVLADKEYQAMIEAVAPLAKAFVCASPPNPRALVAGDLADAIHDASFGGEVVVAESYEEAVAAARELADTTDVICAFGSLYSISQLLGS